MINRISDRYFWEILMIANDYAEIAKLLAKLAAEKRPTEPPAAPEPDSEYCAFAPDDDALLLNCGGWI